MSAQLPVLGATVVDAGSIDRRVGELAIDIDAHYAGIDHPLLLVCVLKGALIFTADLVRRLTIPIEIDFISVRSYRDATQSSGAVELVADVLTNLRGRDVLIVEDIVDSGRTIASLQRHLAGLGARSVRLVALLDKASRRARDVHIDWRGFDIPDRFVVGYGLDCGERYRNLAEVRVLDGV
ncbi:MAG: hypoxanthine phosphoribosyltransferase [Candidatus Dormibacteria bacterium]